MPARQPRNICSFDFVAVFYLAQVVLRSSDTRGFKSEGVVKELFSPGEMLRTDLFAAP